MTAKLVYLEAKLSAGGCLVIWLPGVQERQEARHGHQAPLIRPALGVDVHRAGPRSSRLLGETEEVHHRGIILGA